MKKKNFFIVLQFLMLWPLLSIRADVIPYFYDGYPTIIHGESVTRQELMPKFWCLHVDTDDGGFINMDYRLAGDTLIQGKNYVRVVFGYEKKSDLYESDFLLMSSIRPNGHTYADTLYYRQEEDKVFCLQPEEKKEILIVDYGLEVGDEFIDATGEVFIVKETGRQIYHNKYFFPFYFYPSRQLRLVSLLTGEEDIWIEGLGSRSWGITPYFLMTQIKVFTQLEVQPLHAQVFMGYGGNLLHEPNVNEENYKAEMIDMVQLYEGDSNFVNYEFIGDTLRAQGVKVFGHFSGYTYAECLIEDGRIDIMVKRFSMEDKKREQKYIYDVKIPGFKAGTYEVGMPGQEYVTLECKETTTDYYYYQGQKIPLTLNENKVVISIPKEYDGTRERIRANVQILNTINDEAFEILVISREDFENLTSMDFWEEDSKSVILSSSYFTEENNEVCATPYLNVRLKKEQDIDLLTAYAEEYDLRIVKQDSFLPLWYILSLTPDSEKSPLECANELYETGNFAASTPDLADIADPNILPTVIEFTEGQIATIILPMAPDASKGKYYRIDRCEDGQIIFEQELHPQAETPYIIVPNQDFSIDFSTLGLIMDNMSGDISGLTSFIVPLDNVYFIGTYIPKEFSYQEGFYIDIIDTTPDCLDDWFGSGKAIVGPLRAYLQVNWDDPYTQGGTKDPQKIKEIVLKDHGTGLNEIQDSKSKIQNESVIFDLQGRRISTFQPFNFSTFPKGVYIFNGKKRMVK